MTLQPLLSASWAVQVHVLTLVLALLVGTWQFALSRKGAAGHRARVCVHRAHDCYGACHVIHSRALPEQSIFPTELAAFVRAAGAGLVWGCPLRCSDAQTQIAQIRGHRAVPWLAAIYWNCAGVPGHRNHASDVLFALRKSQCRPQLWAGGRFQP